MSPIESLRSKLRRDEPAIVVNADHPSPSLVEVLAKQPIDAVFIDCEQGSPGIESVENMARAARIYQLPSLVRLFSAEDWVVERYLLRGVDGVVVPRLERAADARRVVETVSYCYPNARERKFVVVQIESAAALSSLDEFLAIDGIDVYFIGPVDLAKSMGFAGDYAAAPVQDAMDTAIRAIRESSRTAGILVNRENVSDYCRKGARFLYTHADAFLAAGVEEFAAQVNAPTR